MSTELETAPRQSRDSLNLVVKRDAVRHGDVVLTYTPTLPTKGQELRSEY